MLRMLILMNMKIDVTTDHFNIVLGKYIEFLTFIDPEILELKHISLKIIAAFTKLLSEFLLVNYQSTTEMNMYTTTLYTPRH